MSYTLNIKNQLATFQFEVSDDNFQHELEKEIFKNKDKMNLAVYRDGKVPQDVMQHMYDRNELLKQTMNSIIATEYDKALSEKGLVPLTSPSMKVLSCQKGQPFIFTVQVYVKPEIQLPTYTGIEVPAFDFTLPDNVTEQVLAKLQQQFSTSVEVTDRTVQTGDLVHIDFEGFLYGRPFPGNKADNFPLTIGSHSFIPGFEEQVIGVGINEAKDFTVTYPENYKLDTLAGQDVIFRCIVRRITQVQLPELTDEFIQSHTKFESLENYKENIVKSLTIQKKAAEFKKRENLALKQIVEACQIEIPEEVFAQEEERLKNEQAALLKNKNIPLEKHLKMLGLTKEGYDQQLHQLAITRIQTRLVLLEIAIKENLWATKEETDAEIERIAKSTKRSFSEFGNPLGRRQIQTELTIQKASAFVLEHVVETQQ